MTHNIVTDAYVMNVVDDNILKHEILYNLNPIPTKHYNVTFAQSDVTTPTTYTAPDGTVFEWDNKVTTLTEIDTEE